MNIFTAITYRAVIVTFLWHLLCAIMKLLAHISWRGLKIACEMLQFGRLFMTLQFGQLLW